MAQQTYTHELKIAAIRIVNQQGYSAAETTRILDFSVNCLRNGLKRFEELGDNA